MRKPVLRQNNKWGILSIATGLFAALPIICLPIGLREGMSPAMVVANANNRVNGVTNVETGEVVLEEWALVSSVDELSSGITENYEELPAGTDPVELSEDISFSDIPKYVIYQRYDDSDLPIELLDPQFFAPDDTTYYVRARQSILKETPDMDSLTLVSLHVGQEVTRTGVGDTWSRIKVKDKENEYEGFVLTNTIQDTMVSVEIDRTVWVDTDSLIVRAEPSTSSEEVTVVNQDAKLYCSAIVGDKWYKVKTTGGKSGYVYKSYTTTNPPPTPTPTPTPRPRTSSSSGGGGGGSYGDTRKLPKITGCNGESIVSLAESMLGKPYVFGGTTSSGVDCAGLVTYCYAQVGISVANGSNTIYKSYGVSVPRSDLKPGDVICYDYGGWCGHVAIYIGDGQVIHASASKGVVKYGVLDMMGIIAIKRFIQ